MLDKTPITYVICRVSPILWVVFYFQFNFIFKPETLY